MPHPGQTDRARNHALIAAMLLSLLQGCGGPQGPPGEGPESLTDPAIQPRVIYTYPPAGVAGPYPDLYHQVCYDVSCYRTPRFQLRFNKIMDGATVRRAIALTGLGGNLGARPADILGVGGDIFLINPVDSFGQSIRGFLPIGESITLAVDTTARDINGNAFVPAYGLTFIPEPEFRVVRTTPPDGADSLFGWETISLAFNSRIDSSIFRSVRIEPPVGAGWVLNWDRFGIRSSFELRGSTTYEVVVDTPAADAAGHELPAPFRITLSSVYFTVRYSYPEDGQTGVPLNANIDISFSEPIDSASASRAFRIVPHVEGVLRVGTAGYISLDPSMPLDPLTTYTVTIDTTLKSARGLPFRSRFKSIFTTGGLPPFVVVQTNPMDGDTAVYPSQTISVTTTVPVDPLTVPAAFHLDPPVAGRFSFHPGENYFMFNPDAPFRMGGAYRATVDGSLRSFFGQDLQAPYEFSFSVRPLRVEWVQPGDGSRDVAPTSPLIIQFNSWIDTAAFTRATRLDPPTPGSFTDEGSRLRFDPEPTWIPETTYTLTIDTTELAVGGGALGEPFVLTFQSAPFRIIQHTPPAGFENQPANFPVWIYFNDAFDTATVRSAFTMVDSAGAMVPGRFGFSDQFPSQFGFLPDPFLTAGSRHTVAVSDSVWSVHGYRLKTPLLFSFRVAQ